MNNKRWRVTYHCKGNNLIVYTYAPNKMFAKWNAKDVVGWETWRDCTKITCSIIRKGK